MRIVIPENIGGEIRVLPEGIYDATLDRIIIGKSKEGHPKATVKWIVTSENAKDGEQSTIGETILDSYSLQPQALWRINKLYKEFAGIDIPQDDYTAESLLEKLEESLKGVEAKLVCENEINPNTGNPMTKVQQVAKA
jgi:hypothetical protein